MYLIALDSLYISTLATTTVIHCTRQCADLDVFKQGTSFSSLNGKPNFMCTECSVPQIGVHVTTGLALSGNNTQNGSTFSAFSSLCTQHSAATL
jgi:hypothetical protein